MTKLEIAQKLTNSPAWDGIDNPHELARAYSKEELIDAYEILDIAEAEYFQDIGVTSKLHYYRLQKNLSQKELAAAAGVSVRLIQDYEQGHRYINNARALLVYKIASALDCNVSDLLELED